MLQAFKFGKWPIADSEVFATSKFAFAFVNLKPLVPGKMHHLIGGHLSTCRRLLAREFYTADQSGVAAFAGHVLVASRRTEPRFGNLSSEEVADIW